MHRLAGVLFLLAVLLTGVNGSIFSHKPNPCDSYSDAWIPYTGYRIQREVTFIPKPGQSLLSGILHWKPKYESINHLVITKCDRGHVKYEAITKIDNAFNVKLHNGLSSRGFWNTTVCTANDVPTSLRANSVNAVKSQEQNHWFDRDDIRARHSRDSPDCYRLARRLKYVEEGNTIKMVTPGTIVGALFECVQLPYQSIYQDDYTPYCSPENIRPLLPLVADKPYHIWTKLDGKVPAFGSGEDGEGGGFSIRISLFFTPDMMSKQYPRIVSHWGAHPGTVDSFHLPTYRHVHKLDRNWARNIDPFEEYIRMDSS